MHETTTRFEVTHEGRVYDVAYTVCAPCLAAEVSALLAAGQTTRQYGAGSGAFSLTVVPQGAAVPPNGAVHEATA